MMKIIKKGKPYVKHKCEHCKTIFIYHEANDKSSLGLYFCPVCNHAINTSIFDKKLSEEKYEKEKIQNN